MLVSYRSTTDINIYDSPACDRLATQMAEGRYLKILADRHVQLLEDDYIGFLRSPDFSSLEPVESLPMFPSVTAWQITERLAGAIAYVQKARQVKNEYLWGGTIPPNFDCSGLIQAAFNAIGIWIPRDAYQQEAFVQPLNQENLEPGDLIFFGIGDRANHVAMYLGEGKYIHSSGKEKGRNGIGIDSLANGDQIGQKYAAELRGFGRVVKSYRPNY